MIELNPLNIQRKLPDLKRCPFCGGEAELLLRRATWFARCKECGISGRSVEVGDPINALPIDMLLEGADEASVWWNRRVVRA